jgi:hypothetical protein
LDDASTLEPNWTSLDGNIQIISNQAGITNNSFNVSRWLLNPFNDNQYSKIQIATNPLSPTGIIEITCRVSGTSGAGNYSYYAVWQNDGQWGLYKTVAGVGDADLIAPTNRTFSTGDTIEIRASGTTISFYHNGTLVQSVTDSSLASGSAGFNLFASNDAQPRADNWEGGNL